MEWVLVALLVLVAVAVISSARGSAAKKRQAADELAAVRRVAEEDVTRLGEDVASLDLEVAGVTLDEAGRILGARIGRRITRIVAPLMAPSAIAGALLVFMTAFNELTVSSLLWSSGVETIGVMIFSLQYEGNSPAAAAVSTASASCASRSSSRSATGNTRSSALDPRLGASGSVTPGTPLPTQPAERPARSAPGRCR